MIGPILLYLQKWRSVCVICTVLAIGVLSYSTAVAENNETDEAMSIEFGCSVHSSEGEVLKIIAGLDAEDGVYLKINDLGVIGVLIPPVNIHPPTIGFAASTFDGSIYTLAVHRALNRPYPDGFDPNMPPATLTVQWTDQDITPVVDVFLGNCLVHE